MENMINKNIMKISEFDNVSVTYRASCECGSKDCDMTLDLEKDKDFDMIFLNLYKDLRWASYWQADNWFKNIWLRIKCALRVLITGYIKVKESFVMREEQIESFIKALEEGKEKLKGEL